MLTKQSTLLISYLSKIINPLNQTVLLFFFCIKLFGTQIPWYKNLKDFVTFCCLQNLVKTVIPPKKEWTWGRKITQAYTYIVMGNMGRDLNN